MGNQQGSFLTAIDVGSAKTCALMAEFTESGLRYRGHGVAESRGSRKGVIVELDKAVAAIQKAVEAAEDIAGAAVEQAIVGIGGVHVRGINSHGGISLGTNPREVGRDEIKQAVDRARAIPLPSDREILHLLPQEFILDYQAGVHDPLGMMASRLEVRVHMVTAATSATQNVITAVNKAGVHVDDTVFEPLAAADSVLRNDELGVADIAARRHDIGACRRVPILVTIGDGVSRPRRAARSRKRAPRSSAGAGARHRAAPARDRTAFRSRSLRVWAGRPPRDEGAGTHVVRQRACAGGGGATGGRWPVGRRRGATSG